MAHKYWVELNYKDRRIGFDSLDKARENAIQMILIQGHKTPTRQANIYSTKTEYSTLKGATTFVGSVVRYSMEFRWIHYYYKEGITLALSDVINLDGKNVTKNRSLNIIDLYNSSFLNNLEKTAKYFSEKKRN